MKPLELRNYIFRRLLLLIPVLFGVTLLIFGLLQLFSPVQRASLYISDPKQLANLDQIIEKYIKTGELVDGIIPVNYQTIDLNE